MIEKLLGSLGTKLTESWSIESLAPAYIFWFGGLVAVNSRPKGLLLIPQFFEYPVTLQISLILGYLGVVTASAFIVQLFDTATLRFLEGYWPLWMSWLRQKRVSHYQKRKNKLEKKKDNLRYIQAENIKKFISLKNKVDNRQTLSDLQKEEYKELHAFSQERLSPTQKATLIRYIQELREMPSYSNLMPTRLGNLLRSSEIQPMRKYGLDAVICWPRLWLLLPKDVKEEVRNARSNLDSAVRFCLWSLLFTLWFLFGAFWALPVGLASALFAYSVWTIGAARSYGILIEATFDTYRHLLYESIRWHLPTDTIQEFTVGRQLSEYLQNGTTR